MSASAKKKLIIGIGIFEAVFLIFALVISIIVFTTIVSGDQYTSKEAWEAANIEKNGDFIGFLQNNSAAFFGIFCIPSLVFIAVDFIYFAVVASKKESNLSNAELEAIKKQAEDEVRAEMLEQIKAEIKQEQIEKKEEKPEK